MPTREWSPLTTNYQVNTGDSDPRGAPVVGIGHHHTATTSKAGALANFLPGGRTVTPNYFIAGREVWGIVPENRRAYTSSSRTYDGQSITYEILNSSGDPTWGFAAETLDTVMRLDAEISSFYGVPFVHALPGYWEHKNVYQWTNGAQGYATACAGPSFRINEVIIGARAKAGSAGAGSPGIPLPTDDEDEMIFLPAAVDDPRGRPACAVSSGRFYIIPAAHIDTVRGSCTKVYTQVNAAQYDIIRAAWWQGTYAAPNALDQAKLDATIDAAVKRALAGVPIPPPQVDYAAIAKAVNDEADERREEWP